MWVHGESTYTQQNETVSLIFLTYHTGRPAGPAHNAPGFFLPNRYEQRIVCLHNYLQTQIPENEIRTDHKHKFLLSFYPVHLKYSVQVVNFVLEDNSCKALNHFDLM